MFINQALKLSNALIPALSNTACGTGSLHVNFAFTFWSFLSSPSLAHINEIIFEM